MAGTITINIPTAGLYTFQEYLERIHPRIGNNNCVVCGNFTNSVAISWDRERVASCCERCMMATRDDQDALSLFLNSLA